MLMVIHPSTNYTRKDIIGKVAAVLREERATATDIESAVDKAGVDRDEVNATFGSMHGLILEMVSDLSGALIQPLEDRATDRAVQDVLIDFGNRLANTYSVSHLIALYRIALNEATRHSGIGREFFERGPGRLTMCLAQYLEYSARRCNQLRIDNPKRVAENFLSLLTDNLELFDSMAATRTSSSGDLSDPIIEAVELFCHGIVTGGQ
jgi:AcrR family transcriptional regulator